MTPDVSGNARAEWKYKKHQLLNNVGEVLEFGGSNGEELITSIYAGKQCQKWRLKYLYFDQS